MKLTSFKRTALAGAAALTLVGASLGVVAAQEGSTAGPGAGRPNAHGQQQQGDREQERQQFIAALAARLGVSTDQLQQAMDQTRTELGGPERGGAGMQGRGGPGGDQRIGDERKGGGLDAAAQALGISVDQLRQELQGQSLTQVAQAHDVDPATVATALKQAADAHIDQEAAAGRIPADQVETAKQRASDRVDQMMAQAGPAGGPAGGPVGREARTGPEGRSR
jgi:transposase-like protein